MTRVGVLLGGGQSRRMGRDKASLQRQDGTTLLDAGITFLLGACETVLVADRGRHPLPAGAVAVDDPGQGPLVALVRALRLVRGDDVAWVLAVDHVAPSATLFHSLEERLEMADVSLAEHGGLPQPFHGVWSARCHAALERLVDNGERSVVRALGDLDTRSIAAREADALAGGPAWAEDVDTATAAERHGLA